MESQSVTLEFVQQLCRQFREQVGRVMQFSLESEPSGLALIDHYLKQARDETRVPVLSLLAAGSGAYFGELIRQEIGGFWIGDGKDPRRLRLLLSIQPIYFAPFDIAYESILSEMIEKNDPRHPEGPTMDTEFHIGSNLSEKKPHSPDTNTTATTTDNSSDDLIDDQEWIRRQLESITPINAEEFHSLTGRYETLLLIVDLLANKQFSEGKQPSEYSLEDYISLLAATNSS